ncbi:MAG TPA: hypothetical protein VGB98_11765 [Pyrinomonadaceae bacterium]
MNKPAGQKRRRRGLIWGFSAVAFVAALLYLEQAALLYVLSTIVVCGLLIVVAFSDLEGRNKESVEAARQDETAAAGRVETTTAASPRPERRVARRKRREAT